MSRTGLSFLFLSSMMLLQTTAAQADATYTVQPEGSGKLELSLPSPPLGSLVHEKRLYVALGARGVAIFDLASGAPVFVTIRPLDGEAVGVTRVNGQPAAIVRRLGTTLLEGPGVASGPTDATAGQPTPGTAAGSSPTTSAGAAGPASPATAPVAATAATSTGAVTGTGRGSVLEVGNGYVVIDRGSEQGLKTGDIVRILTPAPLSEEEQGLDQGQTTRRLVESGQGEVKAVGASRSRVALFRGARAQVGDQIDERAPEKRSSLMAPARLGNIKEASITFRPFLGVGELGFGSVNSVAFTWYGEQPFFVDAHLHPVQFGAASGEVMAGATLLVNGGYDNRYFAVGLGIGGTVSDTRQIRGEYDYSDDGTQEIRLETDLSVSGFTLGQVARLGARDGLRLEVRNAFILAGGEKSEVTVSYDYDTGAQTEDRVSLGTARAFIWGYTQGTLVVPVAIPTDIFIEAGGGPLGYFHIEGGVHTWIRGNGDRGSLGLSVGAGFGNLFRQDVSDYYYASTQTIMGPLVSLSIQRRW